MGKLKELAEKSKYNLVKIKLGKEIIRFNLYEELVVNENKLISEACHQPSMYGYLSMIGAKLNRLRDDQEQEVEKLKALAATRARGSADPLTHSRKPKDMIEDESILDDDYQEALTLFNKLKYQAAVVYRCLKAFEQRASLIQTISANLRKEIV